MADYISQNMSLFKRTLNAIANRIQISTVIITTIGIILGLTIGALVSVPIGMLEWEQSGYASIIFTTVAVIAFGVFFYLKKQRIIQSFNEYWPFASEKKPSPRLKKKQRTIPLVFLDSSAIIDGRIADVARTGFLFGELVLLDSILDELKRIADSKDELKRQRGRRALEILEELRKARHVPFRMLRVNKNPYYDGMDVDERLVQAARVHRGKVLTSDYNLHKKAKIIGLEVLNINELANMVKTVLLPGEITSIEVVHKGKEKGQGLGYLPDGTMVVVEDGETCIGDTVTVEVLRLLQTDAGRMIFSKSVGQG